MDKLKQKQRILRKGLTQIVNQLNTLIDTENPDLLVIEAKVDGLKMKQEALLSTNGQIEEAMEDATEAQLEKEIEQCDEYSDKYSSVMVRFKHLNEKKADASVVTSQVECNPGTNQRKFKLPQFEFKKFSGDIREWLPFWGQFAKIDDDNDIPPEDKIQYLLLATSPNTRAREIVESYPPTAENYQKAVDSLKSRFGRKDLLVEVYVRELLKLVLNNSISDSNRYNVSTLYDKIETQLRSLETLGINTDTCAAMLYPLVESCLPEELIRVWQRSADFSERSDVSVKNRLDRLMLFLKNEVESEERIALAMEGFSISTGDSKMKKTKPPKLMDINVPTASVLFNQATAVCVFCEGNHVSENCFKGKNMSYEEKQKRLKEKKACFKCAKIGHLGRRCRERLQCVLCGKPHIVLLCPDLIDKINGKENRGKSKIGEKSSVQKVEKTELALGNVTDTQVFLQTLCIKMYSDYGQKEVRAIIDTGSQRSYVLSSTAKELRYPIKHAENVIHALFGGLQNERSHNCYEVRMSSVDESFACRFEVLDQPVICNSISAVYPGSWTPELQRANISVSDLKGENPIELLIGADVAGRLLTGNRHILQCGLVAVETLLGWVLMGKVPNKVQSPSATMMVTSLLNKDVSITELWELDVLGIKAPEEQRGKKEAEMACQERFNETIVVNNEGRYEVNLPWIEGHPPLTSNYALAERRLEANVKKLRANGYYDRYQEVFDQWLRDGIIEEVPKEEKLKAAHYLPHRPVIKESRATTKVRPVFDASAKEKGRPCLNDCLEKGVNLIELIPLMLIRFRTEKFGITSDIKQAFLQISLNKADRDFLRFLWLTENGKEKIYRHARVVFGVNASPFLLGATLNFHLHKWLKRCKEENSKVSEQTVQLLLHGLYVDNCVVSVSNEEILNQFIQEATFLMADGKFDLRGWEYNGSRACETDSMPLLGLCWKRNSDVFSLGCSKISELPEVITKRVILSIAQKVFDPIGYSCPATLSPKILLQDMWKQKIGWDTEINEEDKLVFEKWTEEFHYLVEIEIPRWIQVRPDEPQKLSLHTFCDASIDAYAAAVFLRVEGKGDISVHLLQAKSRIAPIKKISIPRLELLAATIGARLYAPIKETLGQEVDSYFWSDSTTVLSWIKNEDSWVTFVWNRVREIRSLTNMERWRYVPGTINPADLLSRGCTPSQLANSRWWEGPKWLKDKNENWPNLKVSGDLEEINKERKKNTVLISLNIATKQFYEYFSNYKRIIRLIAWIYRYKDNCLNHGKRQTGELTLEECEKAEKKLIYILQKEAFDNGRSSQTSSLQMVLDEEGLLRIKTRLSNRDDLPTFISPYVMPGDHPVVRRLIHDTHVNSCHVGTQGLISILREKYWITGGRRPVRSVIKNCKVCRRHMVKRLDMNTPALPVNRIRDACLFEIIGIDFAGPLYLKDGTKVWICLFTCAVFRAVHLELVTSMSTKDFLKTLRRFVARRGRPRIIYTDNGTNFRGAENLFTQLNWEEIKNYSSAQRITWYFNPPSAPWWGGWWERLVGIVKQLLRRILGRASLNYEELYTILCDCEAVVNARPLTYVSSESNDLIPLTPAMFVHELPEDGVPDCDQIDTVILKGRYKYLQRLRGELRRRFRVEYLGQLRIFEKIKKYSDISIGDIVLVGNDNAKRLEWPLGRIVELFPGKDGKVRVVRVQMEHGQVFRPIQKLYPLECIKPADKQMLQPREDHFVATKKIPEHFDGSGSNNLLQESASEISVRAHVNLPSTVDRSVNYQGQRVSRYGRIIKTPKRFDNSDL